jgi:serine phosphatase RsbU (regulator of sigma subunit)/CheY-like chemotaxis protein/anti-sigma regulatory factor (Ser/Thr protein kinase)
VLVVDDVEEHGDVVGTWLREAGYEVIEAATGAEALHAVDTGTVDLVTLDVDVDLPDMSGMEVCERIKGAERTAALPILQLSGTEVDATNASDAHLVEPVESEELLATVDALLRYSAPRRKAVRIAGYLRRLHLATLAVGAASSPEALMAAVADGIGSIFGLPAVAAMIVVGRRSLVAVSQPAHPTTVRPCRPTLPLDTAAIVAADGVVAVSALAETPVPDGVDSFLGAPIVDRAGAVLGAVLVAAVDEVASTEDADEVQVVLDQLAHAISVSVDNLRAFELEHSISLTLQRSLLPDESTKPPGMAVAVRYEAAAAHTEVGGDFYELIELDDGPVLAAVGDVVGHSLSAAIVMAQLRNGLRAYALDGHQPTAIIERLDRLLRRFHPGITATLCLVLIDRDRGRATVANAGHIAPLLVRAGEAGFVEPHGPLIGMGFPAPPTAFVDLAPRDTLLLVTDGLVERRQENIDLGLKRLVEAASTWRGDLDQLCDRVLREVGPGADTSDDIALLALRLDPQNERYDEALGLVDTDEAVGRSGGGRGDAPMTERHLGASFERNSREIARARSFVTDALQDWGLVADAASFELIVSELVSNAIVHGTGPISVDLSCADEVLRLEVSEDGGATVPHVEPRAIGGWGLYLVDEIADTWGSEQRAGRTIVWAMRRATA